VDREIGHTGLTKLHVVASMHERKALMSELSDGFVALPGSNGTLEEFFELVTWPNSASTASPAAC
jgi:predicted Rossmann-fold nucleotide-binding protein